MWNFTLRDTAVDFANVTVWGNRDYIEGLAANNRIGQVGSYIGLDLFAESAECRLFLHKPFGSVLYIL